MNEFYKSKDFISEDYDFRVDLDTITQKNGYLVFELLSEESREDVENRRKLYKKALASSETYLGIGNNGYVCSIDDSENGGNCLKFSWNILTIKPGYLHSSEGISKESFEENYPYEKKLYDIFLSFEEKKQGNAKILKNMNGEHERPNSIEDEAGFQEVCYHLIDSQKINCTIPRVHSVTKINETSEEEGVDNFDVYNHEDGAVFCMEQIKGLSIQDMILNYPETEEYVKSIDFESFRDSLMFAVNTLHKNNICHGDLTMRNVMFDRKRSRPALIDFGKTRYSSSGDNIEKMNEEINKHFKEVINGWLRKFLNNPKETKIELEKNIIERDSKFGI